MTPQDKQNIRQLWQEKCHNLGLSQENAAIQAGTKGSTISQVLRGKYGADDTAIYRLMARWVDYDEQNYAIARTKNLGFIHTALRFAQDESSSLLLIGEAGCGKTEAFKQYQRTHRHVVHMVCDQFMNERLFLQEILRLLGKDHTGINVGEMMHTITAIFTAAERPLLIIDEADKLKNPVLALYVSLYNRLEDRCGIIMAGTDHLLKLLNRNRQLNKKGFQEMWSRLGRRAITCKKTQANDVRAICQANGVTDDMAIDKIIQECEGDLRRVKRSIQKEHRLIKEAA